VCLRVTAVDGTLLATSAPFTESVEFRVEFDAEACFYLDDDAGKELASLWLHAAHVHESTLRTSRRYWDLERHHKGAKKVLPKPVVVTLTFEDDGTLGESGGTTLVPCTDKEYRRGSGGASVAGSSEGAQGAQDEEDDHSEGDEEGDEEEEAIEEAIRRSVAEGEPPPDVSDGPAPSAPSPSATNAAASKASPSRPRTRSDELNDMFANRKGGGGMMESLRTALFSPRSGGGSQKK